MTDRALREPNGLLCAGGDLSAPRLLNAYRRGIFPWYSPGEPILWWSPEPRCVLPLSELHIPRRLQRFWSSCEWTIQADTQFEAVIDACAAPRATQPGTWITAEMRHAYIDLHRRGHAHCVQVHNAAGELIGGIYGIAVGRVFFGESMFSRVSNASKTALFALTKVLQARGFVLLDGQVESVHLMSLGFALWSRWKFEAVLKQHALLDENVSSWAVDWPINRVHDIGMK